MTTAAGGGEVRPMGARCYSYTRFSEGRQGAGYSQERQNDALARAVADEGLPLDTSLVFDDKGRSGYWGANLHKGALGRFIQLCESGVISPGSVLVIEEVRRLCRLEFTEAVALWKRILARGVAIRTCHPAQRYTLANIGELAVGAPLAMFMMMAREESAYKSRVIGATYARKKRKAREDKTPHGRDCPAWLDCETATHPLDDRRVVVTRYLEDPARGGVMRAIFAMCLEGFGERRIFNHLRDNVPPFPRCRRWTFPYVKLLLKDPRVTGTYQPTKVIADGGGRRRQVPDGPAVPGYYPEVIPPDVFEAARQARRSRKNKGGRPPSSSPEANLFTHLVFDAFDGRPLHYKERYGKQAGSTHLASEDQKRSLRYGPLERGVISALRELRPSDVDGSRRDDTLNARVDDLQRERAELGMDLDALNNQLQTLPSARWPKGVVLRMAQLEQAIEAKDEELRGAKEAADTSGRTEVLADVKTALARLDAVRGTPDEAPARRRVKLRLPLLLESVWVYVQRVRGARPPHALSKRGCYVHVRLYLHGGEQRPFFIPCGAVAGAPELDLSGEDFRAGACRGGHASR